MTPKERSEVQGAILASVRAASQGGRPSNTALADAAGCDRSEISRFESGERRMDLDEIEGLADLVDPAAVYAPLVGRHGLRLVSETAGGLSLKELPRASARVAAAAAELSASLAEALEDGRLTAEESDDLQRQLDHLQTRVHRLCVRRVAG